LEASDIEVGETIPASRKWQASDASEKLQGATRLVAMKGKKVTELNPKTDTVEDCVAAMLGPTGNMRAPTIKVGRTLLVGFNEEVFNEVFT
jgi:arsenate reductase-like glutaredoxin family protein